MKRKNRPEHVLRLPGEDRDIPWNLFDLDFLTAAYLDEHPEMSREEAYRKALVLRRELERLKRNFSRSNARFHRLCSLSPVPEDFYGAWSPALERRWP